jgi:hypothetical protein
MDLENTFDSPEWSNKKVWVNKLELPYKRPADENKEKGIWILDGSGKVKEWLSLGISHLDLVQKSIS